MVRAVSINMKRSNTIYEEFITAILGEMTGNAIMGRSNGYTEAGKLKVDIFEWFAYPEELPKMVAYAKKLQDKDVYLSPMIYGDKRNSKQNLSRSTDNALYAQTVFMDSDLCPPDAFRLRPSIHLDTSSGHGHDYWQLPAPVPARDAANVAHKITVAHAGDGCDPSGWSQNKVLRVPGTHNTGHGWPEPVTIQYNGVVYDLDEIDKAYADIDLGKKMSKDKALSRVSGILIPDSVTIPDAEDLPEYTGDLLGKLSKKTFELATKEPLVGEGGNRSEMRWALLLELHRDPHGLTREDKLSIAWNAPSVRKWSQEDSRGMDGLVGEYEQTLAIVETERGENNEPVVMPREEDRQITLITDEERAAVAAHPNFIREYVAWAGEHLRKQNAPYDRINAWVYLTIAFSDLGFIPRENGGEPLNMYVCIIGKTTTGKSQSLKLLRVAQRELMSDDPEFDIGGNATENALSAHLVARDGKVSWFNRDEAQSMLRLWNSKGQGNYSSGMLELSALLYDGFLPAMLRTGNKDASGKAVTTYFNIWLQGTPTILEVLTQENIESGFIPRFQFAIGNDVDPNDEDFTETQSDGTMVKNGFDPVARQWGALFRGHREHLRTTSGSDRVPMLMDQQALDRMSVANEALSGLIKGHDRVDSLRPAMHRMRVTIRKAASLLAMSEGSRMVHEVHVFAALEAAEEWVKNLFLVVKEVADSEYARNVDKIADFVDRSREGKVTSQAMYQKFSSIRKRDLDEYIQGAVSQGYIIERTQEGKSWFIRND